MAVDVHLRSAGMPRRSAPAAIVLAATPVQATGGWYHRVRASYGNAAIVTPGPPIVQQIPPGPTGGHTSAVPEMYPTWSVVRSSQPRVLPRPRYIKPPAGGFIPAVKFPAQDQVVKPAIRVRTGGGQARVTTNPKAIVWWKRQGG